MFLRNENPRPHLIKDSLIINLNGEWDFAFDDENIGHKNKWFVKPNFSLKINVPFPYESKLSGICDTSKHDHIWYHRTLDIKLNDHKKYILNFHGLDFYGEIYVNGELAFIHEGGASLFKFDISDKLIDGANDLTVYCFDPLTDQSIPRGKQYWKEKSESIFYTKTSGIYKNVYLEILNKQYLDEIFLRSDVDRGLLKIKEIYHEAPKKISYEIRLHDEIVLKENIYNTRSLEEIEHELRVWDESKINEFTLHDQNHCWSPENPILYDLFIKTYDENDQLIEDIKTYFAMRKVHIENGIFFLNNRPYYQKLVLNQGYFPEGVLAYPNIEDLKKDILAAKAMGFNGARLHQKVEEPYYYYLCDKLGFIAWLEYPAGQIFNDKLMKYMQKEWHDIILSYYNFPSIITYVPINESWGIPYCQAVIEQQLFENSMYYLCKSLDNSRLVVGNDGWELTKTDIISIHNYMHGEKNDKKTYRSFVESLKNRKSMLNSTPAGRRIVIEGYENDDAPIMLTEFGGVSLSTSNKEEGWGYTSAIDSKSFIKDLNRIYKAIYKSKCIVGYCYTQLYDVEQEINGLLTYERKEKVPFETIKKINDSIPNRLQKAK